MGQPLNVLIIQNSEDDTGVLLRELRCGGYVPEYKRVETAQGLLDALKNQEWDLVLSDYIMPHFGGLDALKIAQAQCPGLPLIIVSDNIGEDVVVAAMRAGAQDYIPKGNLSRLVSAVERELREAAERKERKLAEAAVAKKEKHLLEALKRERDFSDAVLDTAGALIVVLDPEGRIVRCNRAFEAVSEYGSQELLGEKFQDLLLVPEEMGSAGGAITDLLNGQKDVIRKLNLVTKKVNGRLVSWRVTLLLSDDRSPVYIIATGLDITEQRLAEREMLQSEERFRSLFENAPSAIIMYKPDGEILLANHNYLSMYGYQDISEVTGRYNYEHIAPARRQEIIERIVMRAHGEVVPTLIETEGLRKDGSIFPIYIEMARLDLPGIQANVAFIADITDRKLAEAALRESEARLRRIADSMLDLVATVDCQGIYQYVSPSYQRVLGYEPSALLGKKALSFMHPDDRERVPATLRRAFGVCSMQAIECRMLHQDGSYVWVETLLKPLCDDLGAVCGAIIGTRSIDDRKLAEDALHRSEDAYWRIVETAIEGIWMLDEQNRTTFVNRKMADMPGYTPDEMMGLSGRSCMDKEWLSATNTTDKRRRRGISEQYEFRLWRKDDSYLWADISDVPMLDERGSYTARIGMFTNISRRKRAEEALQESEANLRLITDNMHDLVLMTDAKGIIRYASPKMLGYTPEEMLGTMDTDLVHPNDMETLHEYISKVIQASRSGRAEFRMRHADGHYLWVESDSSLLFDESGALTNTVQVVRDISERKQAEELQSKYQLLAEHSRDIILYVCDDDKRIVEANSAAVRVYGYSRQELLTMTIYDLLSERSLKLTDKQLRDVCARGILFEAEHRRRDGTVFPVEVSSQGTTINGKQVSLSIIRDISWRRQYEQRQLLAGTVFAHMASAFIVFDSDGVIQLVNPAFTKITGYTEDEVVGQGIDILGYDRDLFVDVMAARVRADHYRDETWHRKKDGTLYLAGYTVGAVKDDRGRVLQYVKCFRDITEEMELRQEKQRLCEQKERMRRLISLSALSAGIVHEIAQPLNSIKLLSDTMIYLNKEQGIFDRDEFMGNVEDISRQADRVYELIRQVRSFANGGRFSETVPCNVNDAVKNTIDVLERQLVDHGITLTTGLTGNLPPVLGTPGGYEEIVLNLLANAMHALDMTDKEEKEILIRTFQTNERVIIEVSDNATGISEQIRDNIFEPLFSTKNSSEGMGLGLTIVQSIVEKFSGRIAVVNNNRGGATFTLEFPVADATEKVDGLAYSDSR